MDYETFKQNPDAYFLSFIIALAITLFAYGLIPMITAIIRDSPITRKKYSRLCWIANFVVKHTAYWDGLF